MSRPNLSIQTQHHYQGHGHRQEQAQAVCAQCGIRKEKTQYSKTQWSLALSNRKCKDCAAASPRSASPAAQAQRPRASTPQPVSPNVPRLPSGYQGRWADDEVDLTELQQTTPQGAGAAAGGQQHGSATPPVSWQQPPQTQPPVYQLPQQPPPQQPQPHPPQYGMHPQQQYPQQGGMVGYQQGGQGMPPSPPLPAQPQQQPPPPGGWPQQPQQYPGHYGVYTPPQPQYPAGTPPQTHLSPTPADHYAPSPPPQAPGIHTVWDGQEWKKCYCIGARVHARWHGGEQWYPGTVVEDNRNGTYGVRFDGEWADGNFIPNVSEHQIVLAGDMQQPQPPPAAYGSNTPPHMPLQNPPHMVQQMPVGQQQPLSITAGPCAEAMQQQQYATQPQLPYPPHPQHQPPPQQQQPPQQQPQQQQPPPQQQHQHEQPVPPNQSDSSLLHQQQEQDRRHMENLMRQQMRRKDSPTAVTGAPCDGGEVIFNDAVSKKELRFWRADEPGALAYTADGENRPLVREIFFDPVSTSRGNGLQIKFPQIGKGAYPPGDVQINQLRLLADSAGVKHNFPKHQFRQVPAGQAFQRGRKPGLFGQRGRALPAAAAAGAAAARQQQAAPQQGPAPGQQEGA